MNDLFVANTPDLFWRTIQPIPQEIWTQAIQQASAILPEAIPSLSNGQTSQIMPHVLSESLFGEKRYQFSAVKSIYYTVARPFLPSWVRPMLRKVYHPAEDVQSLLNWPLEDRYVLFQYDLIGHVLDALGQEAVDIVGFWPNDFMFSFVLTHDVDTQAGHDYVRQCMDVEEKHGFRSSYNFVPEGYKVDPDLLEEMRQRGFEIGVHGLKHDGRLFSSPEVFQERAKKINAYLAEWGAVGYRSPMTHRNPQWMQSLKIEYDLSFFDTDPYEPMAGGTMSIWPFQMGHFIELPYTLIQDHRYLEVLGQQSPELWLEKVDFLEAHHGMVLLNSHPDYLLKPGFLDVYEAFLIAMKKRTACWHALPSEVASWWRYRSTTGLQELLSDHASAGQHKPTIWTLSAHDGAPTIRARATLTG